jgi:hypothetical protein
MRIAIPLIFLFGCGPDDTKTDRRNHSDTDCVPQMEVCDEVDNDCDGLIDDDDPDAVGTEWFSDYDGDGFGLTEGAILSCSPIPKGVAEAGDCDDTLATIHPGAAEICNGLDDNCDGLVDDDDPLVDTSGAETYFQDSDGDGHGDPSIMVEACQLPSGYVEVATDCDDAEALVNPDTSEECASGRDDDCDGLVDCDDDDCLDACIEVCDDGFDNDQDGLLDCEDADCFDACIEVCDDGFDNDQDGLVDCDDDDCIADESCGATREVMVLGGQMQMMYDYRMSTSNAAVVRRSTTYHADLSDVHGLVQVQSISGAMLSSCSWSFTQGSFSHFQNRYSSGVTPVVRQGLQIGVGCAFSDSAFLPSQLVIDNQRANTWPASGSWYDGPRVAYTSFERDSASYDSRVVIRTFEATKSPIITCPTLPGEEPAVGHTHAGTSTRPSRTTRCGPLQR